MTAPSASDAPRGIPDSPAPPSGPGAGGGYGVPGRGGGGVDGVTVDGFGIMGGFDTWAVPAATLGLPGLLVLLWVAAQALGALAWIPAVRRLRGDEERATA